MKSEIKGKIVNVNCSAKRELKGKKIPMSWELDFSKCSEAQLLTLATRSAVIDYQRQFRDTPATEDKNWVSRKFDVADLFIERKREKLTDAQILARTVKNMTPEAIKQALVDAGVKLK